MKLSSICITLTLGLLLTACGSNSNETTTADSSAVIGSEPAPPSDVDMSKTGVDSLRNTTDIKADTPGLQDKKTGQNNGE